MVTHQRTHFLVRIKELIDVFARRKLSINGEPAIQPERSETPYSLLKCAQHAADLNCARYSEVKEILSLELPGLLLDNLRDFRLQRRYSQRVSVCLKWRLFARLVAPEVSISTQYWAFYNSGA